MDGGGVNSANIASAVWLATTRTPTGLGPTAMVLQASANATIAASGSLDVRPLAGKFREVTIAIAAGAAGAGLLQYWDGTSTRTITSVASGTTGGLYSCGTSVAGPKIGNGDATNPLNYMYGGVDWTQ